MPARITSRRKLWRLRAAAAFSAVVVSTLLLEGALWIVAPVKYHEFLVWIPDGHIKGRARPNQVVTNAAGHDIRINHLGFRGPDWPLQPKPGTLRLIALGGSSTFNYHAHGEDKTWPSRVQHYLQHKLDMPVEVVNLGLPGFDLSNSKVNYLFTGRALNPHVVLVYHTWNDMKPFRHIDRGVVPAHCFMRVAGKRPLWEFVARKTQIGRHTRNMLHRRRRQMIENQYTSLEKEGEAAHAPVGQAALGWFEQNFRDLVLLAEHDDVLPVLITQATIAWTVNLDKPEIRERISNDSLGMTLPVVADTWVRCNQVIENVAGDTDRGKGAIFVNGRDAAPPDLDHLMDAVHLTDRGRDVLAREIAQTLVADRRFQAIVERVRRKK